MGVKTERVQEIFQGILYGMAQEKISTIQYVEHEREERFRENDDTSTVSQLKVLSDLNLKEHEEDLVRLAIERFENETHLGAHFTRTLKSSEGVAPRSWLVKLVAR